MPLIPIFLSARMCTSLLYEDDWQPIDSNVTTNVRKTLRKKKLCRWFRVEAMRILSLNTDIFD